MAWNIQYSVHAGDFLQDLERQDATRIVRKIEQTAENPEHFAERLSGSPDWKIRIGDYRAIVRLVRESRTI